MERKAGSGYCLRIGEKKRECGRECSIVEIGDN